MRRALEAVGTYVLFVGVFLVGFAVYRGTSPSGSRLVALMVLPYLVILAITLSLRAKDHPYFPFGSLPIALRRAWPWLFLGFVFATGCAYSFGLFHPHSWVYRVQNFSSILEAPVVEEIVFRGAILTALNLTSLGSGTLFGLKGGTIVQAFLFASIHLMLLLNGSSPPITALICVSALFPGLLCGYIYQRTGNLWYGVFIHALGNYSQVLG